MPVVTTQKNALGKTLLAAGVGIDTLTSWGATYLLPDYAENLIVMAPNGCGTGNALDNIIVGGNGSQTLNGGPT